MTTVKVFIKNIIRKLLVINDSPKNIAFGYALGIFLATTPLIGFKVLIALIITHALKWNKMAAVVGVYHVNTLNAAFFYGFSFLVGRYFTGYNIDFAFPEELSFKAVMQSFSSSYEVFMSLLVGGIVIGIPLSFIAFKFIFSLLQEQKSIVINKGSYALITGASKGLGYYIAIELAKRNINLLLVSLKNEDLAGFSDELKRKYAIDVQYSELDLAENESVYKIADWAKNFPVSTLINNVGIGGTKAFETVSSEYLERIIQINIRSTSVLTSLMLPTIKSQPLGYILNVASMASFSPIAYKTVYPASKAFIWNFSRCLYEEMKKTNVFVSVIHPGPMKTNPDVSKRIEKQGFLGKFGLLDTQKIAEIAVRQLYRRDSLVIPGLLNKINWLMIQIIPVWLRLIFLSRIVKRELFYQTEISTAKNN